MGHSVNVCCCPALRLFRPIHTQLSCSLCAIIGSKVAGTASVD